MELKLAKKDFADNFLNILGKAVDIVSIKAGKNGLHAVCNKPDSSIIVLGKYNYSIDAEQDVSLNIGDIKKLLRVLDCIEDEEITFKLNSNHLFYKSDKIQFKYHFLDDSIVPKVTLKREKIESLNYDTSFNISSKKLQEILKASSFTSETNKIYLYGQPDGIYCELGDKEKSNTDSVSMKLTEEVDGVPLTQVIPFNLDIFRLFAGVKFDIARVGINNNYKIMSLFIKPTDSTEFTFVISGLVK
jgi:DNA polymerase III sliding clamp (beta) subunit (PCNA family)